MTHPMTALRRVFTVMAGLLMLAVIGQFFLASSGAVNPAPTYDAFSPHRVLGYSILILTLLLVIVSAVARMPGRLIGMVGLSVGLVLLQIVIREGVKAIGDGSVPGMVIFGLHAINGLIIMGVAEHVVRKSRELAWPRTGNEHTEGSGRS